MGKYSVPILWCFLESVHLATSLPALRHNYNSGSFLTSDSCKYEIDNECDKPIAYHELTTNGLGSDLHVWAGAKCWSIMHQHTLVTVAPGSLICANASHCYVDSEASQHEWFWEDKSSCENTNVPMICYWPHVNKCTENILMNINEKKQIGPRAQWNNDGLFGSHHEDSPCGIGFFNQIQYLFSTISPQILHETQKAVEEVFGFNGTPENLIALHVRWGDKWIESPLLPMETYIKAVEEHIHEYNIQDVHIYVTTEDMAAYIDFKNATKNMYPNWKIYVYKSAIQIQRQSSHENVHISPKTAAKESNGLMGLKSLIALLITLEAKYSITTASSNWGRLIDELHEWVWSWPTKEHSTGLESYRKALWDDQHPIPKYYDIIFENNNHPGYSSMLSINGESCNVNGN